MAQPRPPRPWRDKQEARALLRRIRDDDVSLTRVSLVGKGLRDEDAGVLAAALDRNGNVRELWLRGNYIGDDGGAALAGALRTNVALTHLSLGENRIRDGGAEALARMLRRNGAIKCVDLTGNSIEDEGARALAVALVCNRTLKRLDLDCNSIGDGGGEALAWAVCLCPSLTHLSLWSNDIGERGARALASATRNLGGEGVGQEDFSTFAEGLFAETAPIQLGPEELGAIKQQLCAGSAGTEELVLVSTLVGVPREVKRAGQKEILEAVYAAGTKRVVDASIPMKAESAPLILEKVGTTIGVAGVFGIMTEQHGLFMPKTASNKKVSAERKHQHLV